MTTKADFSESEWKLLVDSPFWVQNALVSHRAGGGKRVGDKYVITLDKILAGYRSSSQLVQEVVATTRDRQFEEMTTFNIAKGKIEQIGDLLEEQKVDPADAAEFRKFLLAVGQKAAEETSEGLFGLGDKVSDREEDKLETITVALKATEADDQRRAAAAKKRREAEAKAEQEADRRGEAEAQAKEKAAQEQRAAAAEAKKAEAKKEEAARQREAEARAKARAKKEAQEAAAAVRDRLQEQKEGEVAAKLEDQRKLKSFEDEVAPKSPPGARKPAQQASEAAATTKKEPKTAPEAAPARPETQLYEVKAGDSLSKIAQEIYGDMERWREIYEANKDQIKDPDVIEPGQQLVIPQGQVVKPRFYEVKPGDSLGQIAQDVYGQASRWQEIYEANKDQIKDPNMIQPGQKLRIP